MAKASPNVKHFLILEFDGFKKENVLKIEKRCLKFLSRGRLPKVTSSSVATCSGAGVFSLQTAHREL
jgi:hypothetical protein